MIARPCKLSPVSLVQGIPRRKRQKERKHFFFEKKKQKTFTHCGRQVRKGPKQCAPRGDKSFLVLFSKKNTFLSSFQGFDHARWQSQKTQVVPPISLID
jgi:hypothetical protein